MVDKRDILIKEASELQYALGYTSSLIDLLEMVEHMKGSANSSTITIGELVQLVKIATESLPLYQKFKKENGIK